MERIPSSIYKFHGGLDTFEAITWKNSLMNQSEEEIFTDKAEVLLIASYHSPLTRPMLN